MLIIADDITGAAEIAGIAWRKGLKVNLRLSGHKVATLSGNEDLKTSKPQNLKTSITVIATDTRSGTEEEAVKTIETLLNSPLQGGVGGGLIFKKTDSVLRGHVAAELQALMRVTGKQKALLIPQNPSKGRIVKDGIYYINGTPLDQTSFAYDPEFPAKTAEAKKLLKRSAGVQECRSSDNSWASNPSSPSSHLSSISSPKGEYVRGLHFPDATTLEEIREHVAKADPNTLFAGGADMFEAVVEKLLRSAGVQECRSADDSLSSNPSSLIPHLSSQFRSAGVQTLPSSTSNSSTRQLVNLSTCKALNLSTCEALNSSTEKILLLCGSTQSRSLIGEPFFANKNAIEVTMPEDVFHGTTSILETNAWIATLKDHWQNHDTMIVRIGHEATGGKEYAVRLRKLFGELAYQILSPVQGVQECRSSDDSLSSNPSSLIPHLSSQFRSAGVQTLPSSTSNLSTCQLKQATCQLVNLSTCQLAKHSTRIIIEGGATAYTVLQRLGISSFDVEHEYSPGVVCLSHGNIRIILKPGSYPWGNLFEEL